MGQPKDPQYSDLSTILIRIPPMQKCMEYFMEHIPSRLQWQGIHKYKVIRDFATDLYLFSDQMLRAFDNNYSLGKLVEREDAVIQQQVVELTTPSDAKAEKSRYNRALMSMYHRRIQAVGGDDYNGDITLQRIGKLLEMWFFERYNPSSRSNRENIFKYSPDKLVTYIDQMIIAATYYARRGQLKDFEKEVTKWVISLDNTKQPNYPVPIDVWELSTSLEVNPGSVLFPETLFVERQIKSKLYNSGLYPQFESTIKMLALSKGLGNIVEDSYNVVGLGGV